ncbi:MAG: hypothetical protein WA775_07220 [Psychroserpens sp.]|uniref:hypothetical protein n=1 Tax=Psychroserpens sp. TaxID=2020870 RepID=UPI003C74E362
MQKFILKTLLTCLPASIVIAIYLITYGVPPPNLSNSMSFNAKIQNIKHEHLKKDIEVFSLGSSMSLNNVHTETIQKRMSEQFLNISSWGQNMKDNYKLFKFFDAHYHPSTVIVSSGYQDFHNGSKNFKLEELQNYLYGSEVFGYKDVTLYALRDQSRQFRKWSTDSLNYTSLKFDQCSGVPLIKEGFNISERRWEGNKIKDQKFEDQQYQYVDSLSALCKTKNIKFIFAQVPLRKGFYAALNEKELQMIKAHREKLESILFKNKQTYVGTDHKIWADSLFVDYSHLSKYGSKVYTEYFVKEAQ